jgi:hypothetical protein
MLCSFLVSKGVVVQILDFSKKIDDKWFEEKEFLMFYDSKQDAEDCIIYYTDKYPGTIFYLTFCANIKYAIFYDVITGNCIDCGSFIERIYLGYPHICSNCRTKRRNKRLEGESKSC